MSAEVLFLTPGFCLPNLPEISLLPFAASSRDVLAPIGFRRLSHTVALPYWEGEVSRDGPTWKAPLSLLIWKTPTETHRGMGLSGTGGNTRGWKQPRLVGVCKEQERCVLAWSTFKKERFRGHGAAFRILLEEEMPERGAAFMGGP